MSVAPGAVGMSGARMYMYYTEITPEQKVFSTICFYDIEISWWRFERRGRANIRISCAIRSN